MNKTLKKTIAFLLMVYTFAYTLLLSSCDYHGSDNYFPEGYTGGFHIDRGSGAAYYWVETYEECQAAIELLKSHGSTFDQTVIFTYEGELFDTKYCFSINRKRADKIKYGEDPFDRYAESVSVYSYAFYDDVTIDELIYSNVIRYQSYRLGFTEAFIDLYKKTGLNYKSELQYEYGYPSEHIFVYASDLQTRLLVIGCVGFNDKEIKIPESGLKVILNTLLVVE